MKKILIGMAIAALFAGSASAEWRVYRISQTAKGIDTTYQYATNGLYGTNANGIGDAQTNLVAWNGGVWTNPPFSYGQRAGNGEPIINWGDKWKETWTTIRIVNVVDGQLVAYSNVVTPIIADYEYWQNGTVNVTNDVAGTDTNPALQNVAEMTISTEKGCPQYVAGSNSPTADPKQIKVIWDIDTEFGNPYVVTGNDEYQTFPADWDVNAAKFGSKGFPTKFSGKDARTLMSWSLDLITTNWVPLGQVTNPPLATSLWFGEQSKAKYDESLSEAIPGSADMNAAIAAVKAELEADGYAMVDTYIDQDDSVTLVRLPSDAAWAYDNTRTWVDYSVWLALGRDGTVSTTVSERHLTLVGGFIVDEYLDTDGPWWEQY